MLYNVITMNAIDVLREFNNSDKYIEVYTANAMYHGTLDRWFKEGESTEFTFNELLNILNNLMIVSIQVSGLGEIWSLPGADVRGEYISGVSTGPLIEPIGSKPTDVCSICLDALDLNICKINNNDCKHIFHCDCIAKWFKPDGTITCPECRRYAHKIRSVRYTGFGRNRLASDIRYLKKL